MAAFTICSDFGAQENSLSLFLLFPHLFAWRLQSPLSSLHPKLRTLPLDGRLLDWLFKWFSSFQFFSSVRLFVIPWTVAHQASLYIKNSQSLLKLMPIESVMASDHLFLCHPLLLFPSIFPSIRVFSKESVPLYQVAKVLELQFQHQSFQWISRANFL